MYLLHADAISTHSKLHRLPSKADTPAFRAKVLRMFSEQFALPGWTDDQVDDTLRPLQAEYVHLKRISGAFSNAVFFASYRPPEPAPPHVPPTVLLRVYGSGSTALLSRRAELLILHTLSSLYEIGVGSVRSPSRILWAPLPMDVWKSFTSATRSV